jgi:hypothetical protein
VDQAALEHVQQLLDEQIKARFPGGGIEQVTLLQYGDDPVVEPGQFVLRLIVAAGADKEERERIADDFHRAFHRELESLRDELRKKLPEATRIEIRFGDTPEGPRFVLASGGRSLEARAVAGAELTPVMARLGPTDLETLDTLITAGIASNRADAVRWALARIRERPAYAQLRTKKAEIEELKSQF